MTGEAQGALFAALRHAREAQAMLAPWFPALAAEQSIVVARLDAAVSTGDPEAEARRAGQRRDVLRWADR